MIWSYIYCGLSDLIIYFSGSKIQSHEVKCERLSSTFKMRNKCPCLSIDNATSKKKLGWNVILVYLHYAKNNGLCGLRLGEVAYKGNDRSN